MIDVRADFRGGLDLDNSPYNVARNSYIDALNVTKDALEGSNDMAITNIIGNQLYEYNFPSGVNAEVDLTVNISDTDAVITFTGATTIPPGFVITLLLHDIVNNEYPIAATFTTTATITTDQLAIEMANSMTAIGLDGLSGISAVGNQFLFTFPSQVGSDPRYAFDQIEINSNGDSKNVCIGAYANNLRDTIIYFIWNEHGHHLILEFNNAIRQFANPISTIFSNLIDSDGVDVLGFTENDKITSINVYNRDNTLGEGDLLFFIDSLGRPTGLDIDRFKGGEYTPVTRDILDVAKRPPMSPPPCSYVNDSTRLANNLRNKLFRFKYRYVYDNNEKSTCSPISAVPLPLSILDDSYNANIINNNRIDLSFNVGDKDVKAVELLMSYVNKTNDWSDFAVIDTVNKNEINLLTVTKTVTPNNVTPDIDNASFFFQGSVIAGITIDLSITQLSPAAQVPLASYTTVSGDTISDITSNLFAQLGSVPGGVMEYYYQFGDNVINIGYDRTLYVFNSYDLIVTYPSFTVDNSDFTYSFYNDSTYPLIPVEESIQIFDYVPDLANAQEMPNGNVLLYGGITEGYDRDLESNVVNTILTTTSNLNIPTGSLNAVATYKGVLFPGADLYNVQFTGIPVPGTTVKLKVKRLADNVILDAVDITLTTAQPTANDVMFAANASMSAIGIDVVYHINSGLANFDYYNFFATYEMIGWEIKPPGLTSYDSVPTFLFSTQRKLGIAYFDKKGKTNGILYSGGLTFPKYAENLSGEVLLPYINTKIYHRPPEWAYSYNFYLTKEATQFLYWQSTNVDTSETGYIYFDISNLQINQEKFPTTTAVLSYTFQDGDRLRLVKEVSTGTVFDTDTYDAAIEGQITDPGGSVPNGTYIKIKSFSPFSTTTFSGNYIIQIYRPEQQKPNSENEVYYEFGQQYYIGDPGLSTRYHIGMVSNQNISINSPAEFNFYDGDVYYRIRRIALSASSYDDYFAIDRNFVDNYISAVNSIDGRPSVIDINARRAYYSTLVRFGQAYQANTNINGLNRFYSNNFDEYDYSYGDVMRFTVRDRFIRVFQKLKVGQVPLYHQILKEQTKESLVVTDRLLNPIQYYVGDVGIGDNSTSLVSYRFADYFTSNIRGVICRASNDGVEFISVNNKIDSWASQHLPSRTGQYKVYGGFDPKLANYIVSLEATLTDPAYTLYFDEKSNTFDSFLSYHPEMMANVGTLLVSFKDGNIYTHDAGYNTFYGQTYDSEIKFVFNENALQKKTFLAVSEVASQVWDTPEIKTDINSYGTIKMKTSLIDSDFAELEGNYEATILRDENSPGGILNGDTMKGKYMTIKFRVKQPTSLITLNVVSLKYIDSPLNNR